jgi:type I restriction enzyme S subunit
MPQRLPTGWIKTTLGEIAAPSRERALPAEVPQLRYVGLEHIEPNSMKLLNHLSGQDARSSSLLFAEGDVLYGKMRPYLNKVWVAEFEGICSAEFLVFPKLRGLDSHFLALRLNAEDFVSFSNSQASGERPRVDFEKLSRFPIFLPPPEEQERIVTKVRAALSRMSQAEAAARRAKGRLQRYRIAVLDSAITGALSKEWRKNQRSITKRTAETGDAFLQNLLAARQTLWKKAELKRLRTAGQRSTNDKRRPYHEPKPLSSSKLPSIPHEWVWAAVEQVGEVQLGRQRSPAHHSGRHMRPYLRVANVFEDRIDTTDVMRMNFTPKEFAKFQLQKGDILLNEGQSLELVGRPAMYRNEVPGCCFQNTLVRFRPADPKISSYSLIVFRAYLHSGRFQTIAKITTNLAHLGATRFAQVEFPLPPAPEQAEIVRQVRWRLAAADQLSQKLTRQLELARSTRQTLLRQAFSGYLVPHDPKEGSAASLLARIRLDREAKAKQPKGNRMPKSRPPAPRRRPLLDVLLESKKPMKPEQLFRDAGYEHEFKQTKSQEVVDQFYLELRRLTEAPPRVRQHKRAAGVVYLEALR